MAKEGLEASTRAGEYWGARRSQEVFCPADTRISEVYRSAFLRALAWAYLRGSLGEEEALFFASKTCPVDLALWRVSFGQAPSWWPFASSSEGPLDLTPTKVWAQLAKILEGQNGSIEDGLSATWANRILLAASGPVSHAPRPSELTVLGAFQACLGPDAPNL